MSTDYKFQGWMGLDKKAAEGNLVFKEYEPKPWEETDVDIQITHCGVCGSDLHTLRSGWAPTNFPVVVGHEIVGKVVRVGKEVSHVKIGDRVGVGAQSESCLKCELCKDNNEPYCAKSVNTFDDKFSNGGNSYGGYGDYSRVPGHFVIQLEDIDLPSHIISAMLCGGVTLYSPLRRYGCGKQAKTVGIIGVGGLGHFGVMFAKALGAEKVIGLSRKMNKKKDVLALGADEYIATEENETWKDDYKRKFDLIISTVSSPKMPLGDYLGLIKPFGRFVQVGAPEDVLPSINAFALLQGVQFTGSSIGSPKEIREMLQLAVEKKVKTWANPYRMEDVNKAMVAFNEGVPRYRIVLVNEKHAEMPKDDIVSTEAR